MYSWAQRSLTETLLNVMLGPIEQLCTTTTKLPRFHCNLKSLLGEGAQTSRINPPTMRGIRMVSVICQCRNSWMHEVSRRFTLPGFNPSRGPMPQLQARGFHFDFPSILLYTKGKKKESFYINRARIPFLSRFLLSPLSLERDRYTFNPLPCTNLLSIRLRKESSFLLLV